MRIESLHFKNINSLKGEHEVNFDEAPLNTGGLFAIIGPTGSGKSTLLDAICLALYGRTPRISSVTKNKIEQDGSILTRHQKEAYAKVKFSCNSGTYVSTWSISTNRNGNLREYDMDLWNPSTEKSFSEKKTEVLAEIQRLIGLSYDQFVKSVLLSQGEFATLLKSNEKERSELLEKITNTSIYRQIGRKVYEKYNSLKNKISTQKIRLEDLQKKLLSEIELKEKMSLRDKLDSESKHQELKLADYNKDLEKLKSKEKLDQELEDKSQQLDLFVKNLNEFRSSHVEKINQHAKTLDFEEELLKFNSLIDKKETLKSGIDELKEKRNQLESDTSKLKSKVQKLLRIEVEDSEIEKKLNAFLKQYQQLKSERDLKRSEYSSKKLLLNKELEVLGKKYTNQLISDFENDLLDQLNAYKNEINSIHIEQFEGKTLEDSIKAQNSILSKLKEAKHEENFILEIKERISKLETQLKNEKVELSKYPKLISENERLQTEAEKNAKYLETEKENQNLRLEVKELRGKLMNNEPCPVCGSLDHPFADHSPRLDTELDKKIQVQKNRLQLISREIERMKAEQTSRAERVKGIEREIEEEKGKYSERKNKFENAYRDLFSSLGNDALNEMEASIEKSIENLERSKQLQTEIKSIESSIEILRELDEIEKSGSLIRAKMTELYAGENLDELISNYISNWIQLNSNLKTTQESLLKEQKNIENLNNELHQLQDNLEPKIKKSEFISISEANSSRMKSSEFQALSQQLNELNEQVQIQKEKIKGLETQIKNLKFEFFSRRSDAEKAIEELNDILLKTKNDLEEVKRLLKNNSDFQREMHDIQREISSEQKANKKWEILNKLIGDAQGNEFNKFAQDLSLQRLIFLGNRRLKDLNERYELDRYLPGEDKDQLYVIDHHMGGLRRSVKTLSGGETFLMSLALALGLSDLASKNVEINSLFIDEGFGTLDPETLDVTLDTLERLQAESNKTIGIISHVTTLQERIQTQIVLDRNAKGYSNLKVVG